MDADLVTLLKVMTPALPDKGHEAHKMLLGSWVFRDPLGEPAQALGVGLGGDGLAVSVRVGRAGGTCGTQGRHWGFRARLSNLGLHREDVLRT
jgi:hypothetical protein